MVPPVAPVHNGLQVAWPQPAAGNAYSLWSNEPTKTVPLPTAAEDSRIDCGPASPCHSGAHTDWPQPFASKAFSLPSLELNEVCEPT